MFYEKINYWDIIDFKIKTELLPIVKGNVYKNLD